MTQPKARWKKNPMGKFCGMKRGVTYMSCLEVRMDQRLGYRWVIYKLYPFISIYIGGWNIFFWKNKRKEVGIPWDVKITMKIYEHFPPFGMICFFLGSFFQASILSKSKLEDCFWVGLIPSFFLGALRKDNSPFPSFEELGSIYFFQLWGWKTKNNSTNYTEELPEVSCLFSFPFLLEGEAIIFPKMVWKSRSQIQNLLIL